MNARIRWALTLAASVAAFTPFAGAVAAEPYVATGFPFAVFGVAQPLGDHLTLRADLGTIWSHSFSRHTTDQLYQGKVDYSRLALLADWFPFANGFRLTGGATFNHSKLTMRASAEGGQVTLGGHTYPAPSDLYYADSSVSLPDVMPYIGLGFGHHASPQAGGFSFNVDLGAAIGTAKATPLTPSPALASEIALDPNGAANLASENQTWQSTVSQVKAMPQLTLGLGYRF